MYFKLMNNLKKIQTIIGTCFLTIFLLAILIQIITRYMKISVLWTEEIANFSFIWAIFMGAAVMVKEKEHFFFSYFLEKAKGRNKKTLLIINYIVMLTFTLVVFYYGVNLTLAFWDYNWNTIQEFKMGYIWLCIPISMATMSFYIIEMIIKTIFSSEKENFLKVEEGSKC